MASASEAVVLDFPVSRAREGGKLSEVDLIFAELEGWKIDCVTKLGQTSLEGGVQLNLGVSTNNGYDYAVNLGVPDEQVSDLPALGAASWWTSASHGLNHNTVGAFVRAGLPTVFVGTEGSFHTKRKGGHPSHMRLAGEATVLLAMANMVADNREFGFPAGIVINPERRTAFGDSQGGMVGMGVCALATKFGQKVDYADFTAPAIAKKATPKDIIEIAASLPFEIGSILVATGRLPFRQILEMPATIDANPKAVFYQLAKTGCLLSGEAGRLAELVPARTLKHLTFFKGDKLSMSSTWEKIFEGDDNAKFTYLRGSHASLFDPETQAFILARALAVRKIEDAGRRPTLSDVSKLSHDIVSDHTRGRHWYNGQRNLRPILAAEYDQIAA